MNKILIIRFSSIGDIVLTTALIRGIKSRHPYSQIHYLTKAQYAVLINTNPYVNKLILFNGSLSTCIHNLRKEKYDVIIDLHNNLRSLLIKSFLSAKSYSFEKLNLQKWLLTNFKINNMPDQHIVERYINTADPIGVNMDNKGLDFFIEENAYKSLNKKIKSLDENGLCFCIGGQHETKKLPIEKIINLCSHLKHKVYLIGGKEDYLNGEKIKISCKNVINTCGSLSIMESAALIDSTQLIITHDTGMMHIAAALKKKIVSIWGNTTPIFGMYPYMPKERHKYVIIENSELECRPCSKIGFQSCPMGHFMCMNSHDTVLIKKSVEKLLNK